MLSSPTSEYESNKFEFIFSKFAFVSGGGMFMSVAKVDMAGYHLPISQKANAILKSTSYG